MKLCLKYRSILIVVLFVVIVKLFVFLVCVIIICWILGVILLSRK